MCSNGTPEDRKRWASTYYQTHKDEHAQWQRDYNKTLKGKHVKLIAKAKVKGIEVSLTIQELEQILSSGKCHYCGNDLPESGYSVDRLDNRVGYIAVNCVPCCFSCNARKGYIEGAGFIYPRTVELMMELLGK